MLRNFRKELDKNVYIAFEKLHLKLFSFSKCGNMFTAVRRHGFYNNMFYQNDVTIMAA